MPKLYRFKLLNVKNYQNFVETRLTLQLDILLPHHFLAHLSKEHVPKKLWIASTDNGATEHFSTQGFPEWTTIIEDFKELPFIASMPEVDTWERDYLFNVKSYPSFPSNTSPTMLRIRVTTRLDPITMLLHPPLTQPPLHNFPRFEMEHIQ